MKIKIVKLFQGIRINGNGCELSVQAELSPIGKPQNALTDIIIEEKANGITFRKKGTNIITFTTWNNIQYVEYEDTNTPPKKVESSKYK